MQPQIVLLKEGTETAQGKQQVVSNINACQVMNTNDDYYHKFTTICNLVLPMVSP